MDFNEAITNQDPLKRCPEYQNQHAIISEMETYRVPAVGDDDDIMMTDLDRRILNIDEDDDDFEIPTMMYNLKKDIKIDENNMGIKSYNDNVKKMK